MRAEREGSLAWNHYARLTEIAPADVLLAHFSLEDVSRKVLQRFTHRGSQPTELLPKYTDILCGKGLLRVPAGHRGRKAPAHAQETCLTSQENAFSSQEWADWWLRIGGFRDANDRDANGWTPLHHAIDSMTFSGWRAYQAALALIQQTRDIDAATTSTQPPGYTALHFAADGSDHGFHLAQIVTALVERRANLEALDATCSDKNTASGRSR